jgi:hypothetical protein
MDLPFHQEKISDKQIIRYFSEFVDEEDLKWHFDAEDRIVEALEPTDWLIQFDNKLPQPIEGVIKIPAGVYHRVIKGKKDFKINIKMS